MITLNSIFRSNMIFQAGLPFKNKQNMGKSMQKQGILGQKQPAYDKRATKKHGKYSVPLFCFCWVMAKLLLSTSCLSSCFLPKVLQRKMLRFVPGLFPKCQVQGCKIQPQV